MAAEEVSSEPSPKKPRLIENEEDNEIHSNLNDLSQFKLEKIISNNTNRKTVTLKGSFESKTGDALILLEKTAFSDEKLKENDNGFFDKKNVLEKVFHNDIYGNYNYFLSTDLNSLKATIIFPATEKHFEKYSSHNCYLVNETPEIYQSIVLPHIIKEQFNVQWVYNILDHKSETERIIFEDPDQEIGFILLPDLKWNGEIDTLYLLALVRKKNIKSIRDLTKEHLPLLKNIHDKSINVIKSKYGLNGNQLRIYLHYQPSFYHLHIHFTYLKHEAPGILTERAHLLSTVINNIELMSDYYNRATIPFIAIENTKLHQTLVEKKVIHS